MPSLPSALVPSPLAEDLPALAAARLHQALRRRHDGAVLVGLLEEDLRTALWTLQTLRAHVADVLAALLGERPAPLDLLEAADDAHAQAALVELEEALRGLRRRMAQAAARMAPPLDAERAQEDADAAPQHQHPHRV